MSTSIIHKRRAVSPVIATVILIAVAVALGIAVAFWASGLTSSFSKYEKLGVNTQYATGSGGVWTIYLGGQNTGSSDATITQIQVNGVPYIVYNSSVVPTCTVNQVQCSGTWYTPNSNSLAISVKSGQSFALALELDNTQHMVPGKTFSSGQTIQVTIITAAGNNYPASIVLP
jgi:flagellin-like protein